MYPPDKDKPSSSLHKTTLSHSIGIKLPINRHLKPLIDYQNSIFERPGFLDSLSSLERDLKSEE